MSDRGPFITTFTGKRFYFNDPRPEDICVEDIAVALSRIPRWNGHTKFPYPVSEHSILLSKLMPQGTELEGLFHDADEAYTSDMPRPLKYMIPECEYRDIGARIQKVIWKRFGLAEDFSPKDPDGPIKVVDTYLLKAEAYYLMPVGTPEGAEYNDRCNKDYLAPFLNTMLSGVSHANAAERFIGHFQKLICRRLARRETPAATICICGSTRFIAAHAIMAWEEEKQGRMALGCHLLPNSYGAGTDHQAKAEGVAEKLDAMHRRKIDLAEEIIVINQNGYIGEQTRKEIEYAQSTGKAVVYLEPVV